MPAIPVTVLGPAESGKTVYLASLFRRLAIPREDVGFFVQLPPEESKKLNRIYQKITSPHGWPDPTMLSETSEWEFTCSIRTTQNKVFSPFAIKYIDFSGEHLTEASQNADASARIFRRIKESEFLLVLLDGVKVLRCFDGDFDGAEELVTVFNQIAGSKGIVHFVVTKWDVLAAAGHTVRDVLDCLMQHPELKVCIENRLRQSTTSGAVRFIPVSSVGMNFAVPGPDGRTMIKKGRFPEPLNVEVPFMAVLVDLFQRSLKEMAAKPTSDGHVMAQRSQSLQWIRMIKDKTPLVRAFLRTAGARSPLMRVVQEYMGDALLDYVERRVSEYGDRVEHDIAELRRQALEAQSDKEALTGLIRLFEAKLAEFELIHPGSRLLDEVS